MSGRMAAAKKTAGHRNESVFAGLIGGDLYCGAPTDKPDVIDKKGTVIQLKAGSVGRYFCMDANDLFPTQILMN